VEVHEDVEHRATLNVSSRITNDLVGAVCHLSQMASCSISRFMPPCMAEGAIITTPFYYFAAMRHHDDHEEEVELPPSKTKIKKQMHDLQDIGEQLVALSKDQLKEIELPETLRDAILEAKRITKFGAIKRQMQYIGRLMRDVDAAPIIAKLEVWSGKSHQHIAYLHRVERWRDRLLEDDKALTELLADYPEADAQRLRALIRNALKEKELLKPPKSYREIFQVLREILPES